MLRFLSITIKKTKNSELKYCNTSVVDCRNSWLPMSQELHPDGGLASGQLE
jgi:hypothetical protein